MAENKDTEIIGLFFERSEEALILSRRQYGAYLFALSCRILGNREDAEEVENDAYLDAWNADGEKGFVYTTDFEGNPVIHDRMHWTLAEAINTSSVLYRITGDKRYADDFSAYLEYSP